MCIEGNRVPNEGIIFDQNTMWKLSFWGETKHGVTDLCTLELRTLIPKINSALV